MTRPDPIDDYELCDFAQEHQIDLESAALMVELEMILKADTVAGPLYVFGDGVDPSEAKAAVTFMRRTRTRPEDL